MRMRHGETFTITPHIDQDWFTVECSCGARSTLTLARLAGFVREHGFPPFPREWTDPDRPAVRRATSPATKE